MNGNISDYIKLIDAIDVMVWIIKEDGTIIAVNSQILKRLGYSHDEIVGSNVLKFHPPERAEDVLSVLEKLINNNNEVICNIPIVTLDGSYIDSETQILRGKWEHENVLFGLSRDVTHQRLIERKYEVLFKFAPLPMLISRISDGLIYEVNNAWKKMLQYEDQELIGKTTSELSLYVNESERHNLIQKFISQGYLRDEKISFIRRDGTQIFGYFNASPIELHREKYWITVYTDKTEQHLLRAELDSLKVEAASSALHSLKQQLASNKYIINDPL